MGQRLVTNIKRNGEIIVSAYFHWTGYSSSSFELSSIMIDNIRKINNINTISPLALASVVFEGTDHNPKVEEEERQEIIEQYNLKDTDNLPSILCESADRNEGLIALTKKGLEEMCNAGEVTVEIDITNNTVISSLLWVNDYIEEEPDVAEAAELPFNPDDVLSFDDYQELAAFYLDNKDSKNFFLYNGVEYSGIE